MKKLCLTQIDKVKALCLSRIDKIRELCISITTDAPPSITGTFDSTFDITFG